MHDDISIGSAINKLLQSIDTNSKEVVSAYDVRMTPESLEKHFLVKFNVPKLEHCAANLHIKIKSEEGKKLFRKSSLVKEILSKIESLFPQYCAECKTDYAYELGDSYTDTCFQCKKPAHNCEAFQKLRSEPEKKMPAGFVWLCNTCFDQATQPGLPDKNNEQSHVEPNITLENQMLNKSDSNTNIENDMSSIDIHQNKTEDSSKQKLREDRSGRPVCKYYMRRECRHGKRGDGCDFEHPNMCFKFIQRGERPGGCTKGKNCKYLHPPLCRGSKENRMVCTRLKCKFYHLKGVKIASQQKSSIMSANPQERKMPKNSEAKQRKGKSSINRKLPSRNQGNQEEQVPRNIEGSGQAYSAILRRPPSRNEEVEDQFPIAANNRRIQTRVVNEDDFLDLREKVATMSEQMQWLMQEMRMQNTGPPQMRGWHPTPRC